MDMRDESSSVATDAEETDRDEVTEMNRELERIQTELQNFVFENCDQLLDQMTRVESMESVLESLDTRIQGVSSSLDGIKNIIGEPYRMIANRMVLLTRLQSTCDLLRKILRILAISTRLKQIQDSIDSDDSVTSSVAFKELVKYAPHIKEMEALIESDDRLLEIKAVQKEIKSFLKFKESLKVVLKNN